MYGGIASPNPKYPQEVEVVSGDVDVKVQNKNLFDKDKAVAGEINGSDGSVSSSNSYSTTDFIKVMPSQTYYLSGKANGVSNCFYDKNKNFIQTVSAVSGVLTVPSNENICYLRLNMVNAEKNTFQLEQGTTATAYVEHEEQNITLPLPTGMELCKIGNYKDSFVRQNGVWYKNKVIEKYQFTGNENISKHTSGCFYFRGNPYGNLDGIVSTPNYIVCTHFKANSFNNVFVNNQLGITAATDNTSNPRIAYPDIETTADFKNFLQNNTVIMYFPINTSVLEEITDTTLIEQLEAIYKLKSYNTQTNISQTNDNLPFILDISALRKD